MKTLDRVKVSGVTVAGGAKLVKKLNPFGRGDRQNGSDDGGVW